MSIGYNSFNFNNKNGLINTYKTKIKDNTDNANLLDGITKQEFKKIDKNKDGKVDEKEFLANFNKKDQTEAKKLYEAYVAEFKKEAAALKKAEETKKTTKDKKAENTPKVVTAKDGSKTVTTENLAPDGKTVLSVTEKKYNKDGTLQTITEGDAAGKIISKTIWAYNKKNGTKTATILNYAPDGKTVSNNVVKAYDKDGNLTKATEYSGAKAEDSNKTRQTVWKRDKNGTRQNAVIKNYAPDGKTITDTTERAYDATGRLNTVVDKNSSGKTTSTTKWNYNANGTKDATEKNYGKDGKVENTVVKNYGKDGNLATSTKYAGDTTKAEHKIAYSTSTYKPDGTKSVIKLNYNDGNGKVVSSSEKTVGKDGKTEKVKYFNGNQGQQTGTTIWSYNPDGTAKSIRENIDEKGALTSSITRSYKADGTIGAKIAYTLKQNSSSKTKLTTIKYTYLANGGKQATINIHNNNSTTPTSQSVKTYDADGNLITNAKPN